jgi:preprotein translocase subunit SecF
MKSSRWSLAVVIALLGGTAALASTDTTDVGLDFRKSITLSPQETLTQSKDYYKKMQETQRRVQSLQTKAKKDKDMVKLNCVNDKLAQLQGHMKVTDQSMSSLQLAMAKSDDTARQHEFTRVTILYQKVVTLGTEAEQCIGEDVSYVGATRVDVEIDPSIPPEDPTDPPLPIPIVERPPEASPFV